MAQELDEDLLEALSLDTFMVPLVRLTQEPEPPDSEVIMGSQTYHYDRSYPIKGHSAVMPAYVREQMAAGKKPLVVERPGRFYVYFAA